MTQRRSRKNARSRSGAVKKPELRKPQVQADGSPKPRRAPKAEQPSRSRQQGPKLRMRPDGIRGAIALAAAGWLTVTLVAAAGLLFDRWFTYEFPDSLWLYIAFGMFVAGPAVGYVARNRADIDFWVAQATLVTAGAIAIEAFLAPACPTGVDCGAFGAFGALGAPASGLLVLVLALATRTLARFTLDWVDGRRPRSGRTSFGITVASSLWVTMIVGLPLATTLILGDALIRPEPTLARQAVEDVREFCFGITEPDPALVARPAPEGTSTFWASYLIRRDNEARKGVQGVPLPKDWLNFPTAHPYEAVVSYDANGDQSFLECRKVSPLGGKADKHDIAPPDYASENPIKPRDLLENPSAIATSPTTPAVTAG